MDASLSTEVLREGGTLWVNGTVNRTGGPASGLPVVIFMDGNFTSNTTVTGPSGAFSVSLECTRKGNWTVTAVCRLGSLYESSVKEVSVQSFPDQVPGDDDDDDDMVDDDDVSDDDVQDDDTMDDDSDDDASDDDDEKKDPTGMIVSVLIGIVILLVIVILFFLIRRRQEMEDPWGEE